MHFGKKLKGEHMGYEFFSAEEFCKIALQGWIAARQAYIHEAPKRGDPMPIPPSSSQFTARCLAEMTKRLADCAETRGVPFAVSVFGDGIAATSVARLTPAQARAAQQAANDADCSISAMVQH